MRPGLALRPALPDVLPPAAALAGRGDADGWTLKGERQRESLSRLSHLSFCLSLTPRNDGGPNRQVQAQEGRAPRAHGQAEARARQAQGGSALLHQQENGPAEEDEAQGLRGARRRRRQRRRRAAAGCQGPRGRAARHYRGRPRAVRHEQGLAPEGAKSEAGGCPEEQVKELKNDDDNNNNQTVKPS